MFEEKLPYLQFTIHQHVKECRPVHSRREFDSNDREKTVDSENRRRAERRKKEEERPGFPSIISFFDVFVFAFEERQCSSSDDASVVVLQPFESRLDRLSWKSMRLIDLIERSSWGEHPMDVLSLSLDCFWTCPSLSTNSPDLKSRTTRSWDESANRDQSRERPVSFEDLRADLFEMCDIDHSLLKSWGKDRHSIHLDLVDSTDEEQSDWTSTSVQLNMDRQVNQSIEWRLRRETNDRVVLRFVSERINVRLRPENSVGRRYD